MITWMQKNKKYLVVTIWISVIAFVGAGFVGWGAYDLNKNRATSVASVGHRNISVNELQQKYNQLYDYYSSIFDGKLTQEKAEELGLETLALQTVINENLLLNFADDIGLSVNDEDVLKYIIVDPNFQTDGVFNKNLYYDVLRRARINPNDYEKNLKRSILLNKLTFALNLPTTSIDKDAIIASFFMQDRLAIQVINADESEITYNDDELKKLWESNKNNYMTKRTYGLETLFIPSKNEDVNDSILTNYYNENKEKYKDTDDKILIFDNIKERVRNDYNIEQSKTNALEKYIAVKKGELATESEMTYTQGETQLKTDELDSAKIGETLKPFIYNDGYLIVRVKSITPPQPMTFDQAKEQVKEIYKESKLKEILSEKAKVELNNFKGKDIGFISRNTNTNLEGLQNHEVQAFINQIFDSPNKQGYITLGNKAVIYKILEQKLLTNNVSDEYKSMLEQNILSLKNNELIKDLTNELQKRYEIKEYVKR
ncbi:peptidylprolyl isomerase [Campylobacter sp. faydin G-24]|uniref:Peptidylprolyl isomerase n=1 Tax=Campylobacter anatolicus TaxID=2829105 RepID=A0ABS5HIP7_9BACT|nr:peptidylprolyl isomerase [Campylobacter anatolicus]MBR8464133.1 peptidylprolyl isomerase [Campylobacter anatolicus]